MRTTHQQMEIMNYLASGRHHKTAQEIYNAIKVKLPHISRGTIYRNLEKLKKMNLVYPLRFMGTTQYESYKEDHHHFGCKVCGFVIDIKAKEENVLADFNADYPDIKADFVAVHIIGTCKQCGGT